MNHQLTIPAILKADQEAHYLRVKRHTREILKHIDEQENYTQLRIKRGEAIVTILKNV